MSDMTICDLGTYCNVLARKHLLTADFPLQTITQCREHDRIEAYMKMESLNVLLLYRGNGTDHGDGRTMEFQLWGGRIYWDVAQLKLQMSEFEKVQKTPFPQGPGATGLCHWPQCITAIFKQKQKNHIHSWICKTGKQRSWAGSSCRCLKLGTWNKWYSLSSRRASNFLSIRSFSLKATCPWFPKP